jgi:hypothetical protein
MLVQTHFMFSLFFRWLIHVSIRPRRLAAEDLNCKLLYSSALLVTNSFECCCVDAKMLCAAKSASEQRGGHPEEHGAGQGEQRRCLFEAACSLLILEWDLENHWYNFWIYNLFALTYYSYGLGLQPSPWCSKKCPSCCDHACVTWFLQ